MSQLLNAGDKSYTCWESGESIHKKSTETLIRIFAQHPELVAEINAQRERIFLKRSLLRGNFAESTGLTEG